MLQAYEEERESLGSIQPEVRLFVGLLQVEKEELKRWGSRQVRWFVGVLQA